MQLTFCTQPLLLILQYLDRLDDFSRHHLDFGTAEGESPDLDLWARPLLSKDIQALLEGSSGSGCAEGCLENLLERFAESFFQFFLQDFVSGGLEVFFEDSCQGFVERPLECCSVGCKLGAACSSDLSWTRRHCADGRNGRDLGGCKCVQRSYREGLESKGENGKRG